MRLTAEGSPAFAPSDRPFGRRDRPIGRRARSYSSVVGASVTLSAPSVRVEPGQEAAVELRLRNDGRVVDEFTLDVLGDSAAWAVVEPPTLSLFPGAEGTARVVFRPPRAATTPAGPIPFGVRAASREDPQGSSVEEGTVEVGSFLEPFAELVPRTSRGSRGAAHDLAVDNRGNVRLNAVVQGGDADNLLRFDVAPPSVVVEPGEAGFAKVKVRPTKTFWRGPAKTRPFQLSVVPEDHLPITLDGALLQEAILPPWFGRAVAALLALLIGALLFWFLVLRPSIQSAATEALESPLASLRSDVNSALGAAGLPTMPAEGGGVPSAPPPTPTLEPGASAPPPTPTPTPGTAIPGLGTPVDGVLREGSTSFEPSGTLFVTDLVFSNLNGREGVIVVRRGGTELLRLALGNIRDLDYHFVTPIVIPAGDSLNIDLACVAGTDQCDAALFYSGYLRP